MGFAERGARFNGQTRSDLGCAFGLSNMSQSFATNRFPASRLPLVERSAAGRSYLTSSFDLRAGLEVGLLTWAQVPTDLLRELVRLQACWRQGQ